MIYFFKGSFNKVWVVTIALLISVVSSVLDSETPELSRGLTVKTISIPFTKSPHAAGNVCMGIRAYIFCSITKKIIRFREIG